jgi:hypothetical protein
MNDTREIPDEVERQMFIKEVPPLPSQDEMQGKLTIEQIAEFPKSDQAILAAIDRIEQYARLNHNNIVRHNRQTRQFEASFVTRRQKINSLLYWIIGSLFVAAAGAIAAKIFHV